MGITPDDEHSVQADQMPEPVPRRRDAPTIELKASSVSDSKPEKAADSVAAGGSGESAPPQGSIAGEFAPKSSRSSDRSASRVMSWIVPAITGAAAAAAVVAVFWAAGLAQRSGYIAGLPSVSSQDATDAPAARVGKLETNPEAKPAGAESPPANDVSSIARIDALEKSMTSLRETAEGVRADSERIAKSIDEVKSAQANLPPPPDLAPLEDRIAKLEKATVSLTAQAAVPQTQATPPDNPKIRAAVAAISLENAVRQGEPYSTLLSNVSATSDNGAALKPLEPFAASGVPSAKSLCSELLALVTKANAKSNSGPASGDVIDRLRAGASRLVRVERTDSPAAERASALMRIAAAANRDDVAESKREIMALSPSDREQFQPWLDKAAAREAALSASRQFASDAMLSLSSSAR